MPVVIVANKVDKLNQSEQDRQLNLIREEAEGCEVIPYSAVRGFGRDRLLESLF
jgi:50S ribosomal subunit-associated GTPase HflX